MSQEKIFADGFSFKRQEKAPDFVIGRLSIKIDDAVAFMRANDKQGWVNLDVKKSQNGKYYLELDTYVPKQGTETKQESSKPTASKLAPVPNPAPQQEVDDLPF